ncbi:MAG: hypothetical protein ACM31L_12630 [Actinomycetota bacterium]
MTTALALDDGPLVLSGARWRPTAPILSLLLHLLAAMALGLGVPWSFDRSSPTEPAIDVEVVAEAPKRAEPPPPAPPPASPQAAPQPVPPQPAAPPARPLPPPPVLKPAPPAPLARPAEPAKPEGIGAPTPTRLDRPARQEARDIILSQVLPRMSVPPQLRGRDAVLTVDVEVRPGGLLAPPFARDLPWNPEAAIDGLDAYRPGDPRRTVVESFYRALRDAQPLRLPPELAARLPFKLSLDFRFDDVP